MPSLGKRKRKRFMADFETTTAIDDCRVWAWGLCEIGNKKFHRIGNKINTFMQWAISSNSDIYFHNLKFDGEFIVNWLLKCGWKYSKEPKSRTFNCLISGMGTWYQIDICTGYVGNSKIHVSIKDSLKKLPFTVDKIGRDFDLGYRKIKVDQEFYTRYREPGHILTDEEEEYLLHDIFVVADALEIQFNKGLKKLTNGSDALGDFKTILSKKLFDKLFPVLDLDMDSEIRKAYRGGFTWLNDKYKSQEIGEGIVFDVNSLYPSVMYSQPLPFGKPVFFEGEYTENKKYPLYIQRIRMGFTLKDGMIPTIQIKKSPFYKENEYLKSSAGESVELYLTNIDLTMIREHYDIYDVEFIDGWMFQQTTGVFNQYIDKWTYEKTHFEGARKLLAKLMLNSLYGKFATNPDITGKHPYLKEDGSTGYKKNEQEFRDPVYTPMGVFITSWARWTTITAAQKCYNRIIYCDTDSIHLKDTEIPENIVHLVDSKKLGFWKHESTYQNAKYLRQKTYTQNIILDKPTYKIDKIRGRLIETNRQQSTKCAGMPDNIKKKVTFKNFKMGFTSMGKLAPKHVNNGIVLVDSPFSIK